MRAINFYSLFLVPLFAIVLCIPFITFAAITYTPLAWPASTGYKLRHHRRLIHARNIIRKRSDPLVGVSHPASWGYPAGTVNVRILSA